MGEEEEEEEKEEEEEEEEPTGEDWVKEGKRSSLNMRPTILQVNEGA